MSGRISRVVKKFFQKKRNPTAAERRTAKSIMWTGSLAPLFVSAFDDRDFRQHKDDGIFHGAGFLSFGEDGEILEEDYSREEIEEARRRFADSFSLGRTGERRKEEILPGGTIVLSVEITKEVPGLFGKLRSKAKSLIRRFFPSIRRKLIEKGIREVVPEDIGWSIGNLFRGHYVSKGGQVFNEHSLAVEIRGITSGTLDDIAEHLARIFDQESVLVKDDATGKVSFVYPT